MSPRPPRFVESVHGLVSSRLMVFLVVGLTATFALAAPAFAHTTGLSSGEYVVSDGSLHAKLTFSRAEIAALLPQSDANRDGHISALELESAKPELDRRVFAAIHVSTTHAPCVATLSSVGFTEQDGLSLSGRFDCRASDGEFAVDLEPLLVALSRGHRHVARAVGATTHDEVLTRDHARFIMAPGPAAPQSPAVVKAEGVPKAAWAMFTMGIEHVGTGYDHLAFLLALALVRSRRTDLVFVVTSFTVAHSITLAIGTLGLFTLSPRVVEPAIALSIVYVALENFFVVDASKRWRIAFPFGLVHGFGFARALQQVELPQAHVPAALLSFNLGVELGQISALVVFVSLLRLAKIEVRGTRWLSGVLALAGSVWFVARVAQ